MARKYSKAALSQASALDGFVEDGKGNDFNSLPVIERTIIRAGGKFVKEIQKSLKRLGKVSSGALADNITQGDLDYDGLGYELDLGYDVNNPAAKYYDSVNKGVRGADSGKSINDDSPYKFDGNKKMIPVKPVLLWLRSNANQGRKDLKKIKGGIKLSALQNKRQSLKKAVDESTRIKSLGFAIATTIYQQGLEKTLFFDQAVDKVFGPTFTKDMQKAVGKDVSAYITKFDKLINE